MTNYEYLPFDWMNVMQGSVYDFEIRAIWKFRSLRWVSLRCAMRRALRYAVFVLGVAVPTFAAADSPWDGVWKVNEAKSNFTGRTFTISEKGGMMHYSNGGPVEYDFACDGKDYPTVADHTFACRKTGETTYETVSKVKGQETSKSQREISRDGKRMTITVTGRGVDGSTYDQKVTFARVGGRQGLVGTWKTVKDVYSGPEIMKVRMAGGVFRAEYPSTNEVYEGKLDGSSIVVTGPQVTAGTTTEMTTDGPRAFRYVIKLNGKDTAVGRGC